MFEKKIQNVYKHIKTHCFGSFHLKYGDKLLEKVLEVEKTDSLLHVRAESFTSLMARHKQRFFI